MSTLHQQGLVPCMWVQQGLRHYIAFSEEQLAILLHVARLRGFTVMDCPDCPHHAPDVDLEQIAAQLVRPELAAVVKEGNARLMQPFLPRERLFPRDEPVVLRHSGELPSDAKPIAQLARRHCMNESGAIDQARRGLIPHYTFQRRSGRDSSAGSSTNVGWQSRWASGASQPTFAPAPTARTACRRPKAQKCHLRLGQGELVEFR